MSILCTSDKAKGLLANLKSVLSQDANRKIAEQNLEADLHDEKIFECFEKLCNLPGSDEHVMQLFYVIVKNALGNTSYKFSPSEIMKFRQISIEFLLSCSVRKPLQDSIINFLTRSYAKEKDPVWQELLHGILPTLDGPFNPEKLRHYASALRLVQMITKLNWNRYISFGDDQDEEHPQDKKKNYDEFNAHVWQYAFPFIYELLQSIIGKFYSGGELKTDILTDETIRYMLAQGHLWDALHMISKIFWSSSLNDMESFAHWNSQEAQHVVINRWIHSILILGRLPLDVTAMLVAHGSTGIECDNSEQAKQWKVVKWTLTFVNCFINCPLDRKGNLTLSATSFPGQQIAGLLHSAAISRVNGINLSKKAFVTALGSMETILVRKKFQCLNLGQAFFEKLIEATFNELRFNDTDEELFTDSPMEFLENNVEICYDTYDPRSSSYRLLKSLLTRKFIKNSPIPSTFFLKIKDKLRELETSSMDSTACEKYAYACVVHRLSSILKKNVAPEIIFHDFLRHFLRDMPQKSHPFLQFASLQIVTTYAKVLKKLPPTSGNAPFDVILSEIISLTLQEPVGIEGRVVVQVQQLRSCAALIEEGNERCIPIVEPVLVRLMEVALQLLQLDTGVQTMILDAVATFIEYFPAQLDPVLSQLCNHFVQHVYSIQSTAAQQRAKSLEGTPHQSMFEDEKKGDQEEAEFNQQDATNSAVESTLRTLYTIVSTMVLNAKWHTEVQKMMCPFLKELLSFQDDTTLCLMEHRELIFEIFELIATQVRGFIPEAWDLLELAYHVISSEDDQFFVCECGSKIFDISKSFLAMNFGEFISRDLPKQLFEISSIFLDPSGDKETDFFDDIDRIQALDLVDYFLQEVQKHPVNLTDGLIVCVRYVVKTVLEHQNHPKRSKSGVRLSFHLYRVVLSLMWLNPETLVRILAEYDVSITGFMEIYADFMTKAPRVDVYDRNISIVGLSSYLRWVNQNKQSVNFTSPRVQSHLRKIFAVLHRLLDVNSEFHVAYKNRPVHTAQHVTQDDVPDEDEFETDEDDDDSDEDGNARDLDDAHWGPDEGESDEESLDEDNIQYSVLRTCVSATLRESIAASHELQAFFRAEGMSSDQLDSFVLTEQNFLQQSTA